MQSRFVALNHILVFGLLLVFINIGSLECSGLLSKPLYPKDHNDNANLSRSTTPKLEEHRATRLQAHVASGWDRASSRGKAPPIENTHTKVPKRFREQRHLGKL